MAKFFVVSDIHGYYDELIKALNEAGFDKDNESHWLITCGDHFDRGGQPVQVMKYLMSLPRKILIKGNHEQLFVDLCERGFPYSHDRSNGTLGTVFSLDVGDDCYNIDYDMVLRKVKPFFNNMVNYFETKNHIFVHSWIPLIIEDSLPAYYTRDRQFSFNDNWRNASDKDWQDAMWGNPFKLAAKGLLPDKTIVFGHWHCSTGWAKAEGRSEFGNDAKFDPYYGNGFVSIDACCAYSGKINCIVIEDEFLGDDKNE